LSIFFVDTSALAKRYLSEVGSGWVKTLVRPAAHNRTVVAELARVEMFSLLARYRRQSLLTASSVTRIQNTFLKHYRSQYWVIPLNRPVLLLAARLVDQHPLRTLDAIQLSCALESRRLFRQPISFISADNNLLGAAAAEGFSVDNPNNHP
jgi:predicted nucleic acid-binding protein